MDPVYDKLNQVELELADLRRSADRLSLTVARLKDEIREEPIENKPVPVPPPLPEGPLPPRPEKEGSPQASPAPNLGKSLKPSGQTTKSRPATTPLVPAKASTSGSRDLEMQLGRVWSVRIGIVLLTTGFIFLSRYTYDAFIRDLGPELRLTMMYFLAFSLSGAGFFFERWNESLRTYGRIVAAGGLAAIYYCGYAAYHVESLKVIDSPVTASLLLLISAGLFCGLSLWKQSRTLLSASLALAFYSVSINPIGWMGCLSALILSGLGITIMLRKRWFEVGFLVLAGSYLSYFWWQFTVQLGAGGIGHWYLPAYWLLFAAASLAPGRFANSQHHLLFTSINNGAFFLLFSFRIAEGTWMELHDYFCFIFGTILLGIFAVTRHSFPKESRIAHLVKGLGLITLGFAILLDGHQLFLVLLLEAVAIMAVNVKTPYRPGIISSWMIALLSLLALAGVSPSGIHPMVWGIGASSWITLGSLHRLIDRPGDPTSIHYGAAAAGVIAFLTLAFGLMTDWGSWDRSLCLSGIGTVSAGLFLIPAMRRWIPETLAIFATGGTLALALVLLKESPASLSQYLTGTLFALLSSIVVTLITIKANRPEVRPGLHLATAGVVALLMALIWHSIDHANLPSGLQLSLYLALPILGTLTANRTRLLACSLVPFFLQLAILGLPVLESNEFLLGLVFIVVHLSYVVRFHDLDDRDALKTVLSLMGAIFWAGFLITGLESPGVPLSLTAVALFAAGPRIESLLTHMIALPYFFLGGLFAVVSGEPIQVYLCLFPLLILHLVRSFRRSEHPLTPITIATLLGLWIQLTRDAGNMPLAAVWGITGTLLLLCGLGAKSRSFRLTGLLVLTFSLGHLMIFDVVKLRPLPRIMSFMTLGIGLLALGFVYNRFQDRLKQIL